MSSGEIVTLNVGGSIFQTSKSTLSKFDGFFNTMLEAEMVSINKDKFDNVFIDRSPKHFDRILNYMRDGDINLQKSSEDVKEILKEAQFYGLEELVQMCSMELENRKVEETSEKLEKINLDEKNSKSSGAFVKLNVGGSIFQAARSTLTKHNGFFKTMLEGGIPCGKDESGAILVDRSARHFDRILDYMRDGRLTLPESSEEVEDIQKESRYYLLEGLVQLCRRELQYRVAKSLPVGINIKILESKKEYFQLIAKPAYPTLVIYCPIVWGAVFHPKEFELEHFLFQYDSKIDIYFRPFEHIPTVRDDILWSWSLHWKENHHNDSLQDKCDSRGYPGPFETELRKSVEKFLKENRLV